MVFVGRIHMLELTTLLESTLYELRLDADSSISIDISTGFCGNRLRSRWIEHVKLHLKLKLYFRHVSLETHEAIFSKKYELSIGGHVEFKLELLNQFRGFSRNHLQYSCEEV